MLKTILLWNNGETTHVFKDNRMINDTHPTHSITNTQGQEIHIPVEYDRFQRNERVLLLVRRVRSAVLNEFLWENRADAKLVHFSNGVVATDASAKVHDHYIHGLRFRDCVAHILSQLVPYPSFSSAFTISTKCLLFCERTNEEAMNLFAIILRNRLRRRIQW